MSPAPAPGPRDDEGPPPFRVVALGASNLTRGLHTVVSAARETWGPGVEVVAALGHGRSYGASSRVAVRTLPGILESGLWRELESRPAAPTRALVTDVGNDILYGYSVEQTLDWVDEAVRRLRRSTSDIVLTDLPLASIRRLPAWKYVLLRTLLFPSSRLPLADVRARAERLNAGLLDIAATPGIRLARLRPEWYGFDPIHIRPGQWRAAWTEILGMAPTADGGARRRTIEGLRLYAMPPERQWLFGIRREAPQTGRRLPAGGTVWLF